MADLGVVNGRRRRKYVYADRQAEVIVKLRRVREQIAKGLPPPDDQLTVNHLLDRWYADVLRHQVAPSAYENYTTIADKHVRPAIGRRRVSKLTPADVDALISAKVDEGLSVSTVRRIRAVLAQALGQAERWGLVARNVVERHTWPPGTPEGGPHADPAAGAGVARRAGRGTDSGRST